MSDHIKQQTQELLQAWGVLGERGRSFLLEYAEYAALIEKPEAAAKVEAQRAAAKQRMNEVRTYAGKLESLADQIRSRLLRQIKSRPDKKLFVFFELMIFCTCLSQYAPHLLTGTEATARRMADNTARAAKRLMKSYPETIEGEFPDIGTIEDLLTGAAKHAQADHTISADDLKAGTLDDVLTEGGLI